ncbi:MAG TPA: glycoside hydrolase family protein [Polyangiaceae bacterium]|nr:glycoside hydrolase family protein [Polyangiaceae bacterium]
MANENMTMSADGMTLLRLSEGAVLRYYNDLANNCTYGIGTLVHAGACTQDELRLPVTEQQVNAQLAVRVRTAESAVRRGVPHFQLTQAQFDALVSFVYNVGAAGAATALAAADRGASPDVVADMNARVYVHPRDAQGRRLPAVRVQGLVNRRQREAAPFVQAVPR